MCSSLSPVIKSYDVNSFLLIMAHHRWVQDDSAAIFSPSVARIAASTARDWAFVDLWLLSMFRNQQGSPPPFERNQATLKALLDLATFNENADEHCQLLAHADVEALRQLTLSKTSLPQLQYCSASHVKKDLLEAIEHYLPKEGMASLQALASMDIHAGLVFSEPKDLGHDLISLHHAAYDTARLISRVETLEIEIRRGIGTAKRLSSIFQDDDYKPPSDLAKQNLDLQRKIKTMSAQLPEIRDRVAVLAASVNLSHPTIDKIANDELEYLAILARKRSLDAQMATFAGLPNNPDIARSELDALQRQLREVTVQREIRFEYLIERESPVKRR